MLEIVDPGELINIAPKIGIKICPETYKIPKIPFSKSEIKNISNAILVLGLPVNIHSMYLFLGTNSKKEPCFYNQDWYVNEYFARENLGFRWYLIAKKVLDQSRGKNPESITDVVFPSAVLLTYVFFVYYFYSGGETLWEDDFLWCGDTDHNGDRIYVGRYSDPACINKNGWNIHRHLKIRDCYGIAPRLI